MNSNEISVFSDGAWGVTTHKLRTTVLASGPQCENINLFHCLSEVLVQKGLCASKTEDNF